MSDLTTLSIDQLKQIIADATAEIARREQATPVIAATAPVRVAISHGAYNERRYGKPWIAVVVAWPVAGRPELSFGRYTGRPGEAGDAEVMARPGQIVRWGQKDGRGGNTEANWGVVQPDGSVQAIDNQAARQHWGDVASKIV